MESVRSWLCSRLKEPGHLAETKDKFCPRSSSGSFAQQDSNCQVSSHPALSLHIRSAVQVILSLGSLRRTQVSGHFWVFLSAAESHHLCKWQISCDRIICKTLCGKLCPFHITLYWNQPTLPWLMGTQAFWRALFVALCNFQIWPSSKAQGVNKEMNIFTVQCWWWQWKVEEVRGNLQTPLHPVHICSQFTATCQTIKNNNLFY